MIISGATHSVASVNKRGWNMRKINVFFLALTISVSLCACQNTKQDISDAYEKRNDVNISMTSEEAENSSHSEEETMRREMFNGAVVINSDILNTGDEMKYMGISFNVQKAIISESIDELNQITDEKEAEELKQRVLSLDSSMRLGMDEKGKIQNKDNGLVLMRCSFTNTSTQEMRLNMEFALYMSKIDLSRLGKDKRVALREEFDADGQVVEFSGKHDEYICENVGVKTGNSSMYHVLKPQETFETTLVIWVSNINKYEYKNVHYYILSSSFTNRSNLNFPEGSYMLPIKFENWS